jgi:hypothetical protein
VLVDVQVCLPGHPSAQCFTADAQSQADKLVTFVYKLNGDEVKVEKSHYPK